MSFRFQQGDRPLTGYTIQRGVGRGGFGEVYYATSDGGKEVALKYLRDNPQVELRGATHCLNLKSPYLVTLYDVKQNPSGEFFVVMEYVNGLSLRDLMNEEAGGLGAPKAAYFLREIGKGLSYLHDRGIVHRDLKPGNIFYEDGYVKIGDYGLSKLMAASQHSGQTISVGTLHYMAPEVGSGNYDRTIDIYSLGVMLYEMLLGRVPFSGATMGEVLMKHLTAQPAVDELPEPFPHVIRKALAKDPRDRYQTVGEMMSDLFAVEDVSRSVASLSPDTLSMAAARTAGRIRAAAVAGAAGVGNSPAQGGGGGAAVGTGSSNVGAGIAPPVVRPGWGGDRGIGRAEDGPRAGVAPPPVPVEGSHASQWFMRIGSAVGVCALLSFGLSLVSHPGEEMLAGGFFHSVAILQGVLLADWWMKRQGRAHGKWAERGIVTGASAIGLVGAMILCDEGMGIHGIDDWFVPLIASMMIVDWPGAYRAGWRGRVDFGKTVWAGLAAVIFSAVTDHGEPIAIGAVAATACLAVQTVGAIRREPAGAIRSGSGDGSARAGLLGRRELGGGEMERGMPVIVEHSSNVRGGTPPLVRLDSPEVKSESIDPALLRSTVARRLWLLGSLMLVFVSVTIFIATGVSNLRGDEEAAAVASGVGVISYALFAFTRSFGKKRKGLWRGIARPLVFFTGLAMSACTGVVLGMMPGVRGDEQAIGVGLILFGAFMALGVWIVPMPAYVPKPQQTKRVVELPIRRTFVVDSLEEVNSALERFTTLFNFTPRRRGDRAWSFVRGNWASQFWQSDIRAWRTTLNIAVHRGVGDEHRITCILDVDARFNQPDKNMLGRLDAEMEELREMLGAREAADSRGGEAWA